VWDAATLTRAGSIDGVPGIPTLTPDGKYVAFLVRGAVALLGLATARVAG
jgi:hypothetical protein